ncbi:MAG: hypothetical protein M3305_16070 [Actinomycetota bacterium]|nr:hypothetical protein [Actinomycetota bacterium]
MCKEHEKQFVLGAEVRFRGRLLATYIDAEGCSTLYRVAEDRYFVYLEYVPEAEEDGEDGLSWLESGDAGNGLTEEQVRIVFPEFEVAITRAKREAPRATSPCCR